MRSAYCFPVKQKRSPMKHAKERTLTKSMLIESNRYSVKIFMQ
jgi:hypothetical protein